MNQELWRVHRVARLLDVTKKRIYQMVNEGKLDAVRLGPRSMRITRESIDLFVQMSQRKNREDLGLLLERFRRATGRSGLQMCSRGHAANLQGEVRFQ